MGRDVRVKKLNKIKTDFPVLSELLSLNSIHPILSVILQYIQQNYPRPEFYLEEVSAQFNYKADTIERWFKQEFDYSIHEYIQQLRLAHFIELYIQHPGSNANRFYPESGFISYKAFHRTFSKYFKISFREYKRKFNQTSK